MRSFCHLCSLSAIAALAVSCQSAKTYRTTFHYSFTVDEVPAGAGEVAAWVPIPRSNGFQEITNLRIEPEPTMHRDPLYGNQLAYLTWSSPTVPPKVSISYDLARREETAHSEAVPAALKTRYLEPDRLGVIDEQVREWSSAYAGDKSTTTAKARALYDFVLSHMTYNKEVPGWGRGDTKRACMTPHGNCSDFHALFISLARAAGIPARFHYGYSLKAEGQVGPHCWAQFWDEERGWVPVDISEADKAPARTEYFFGTLSEDRVDCSVGRDLVLDPQQKGEPLNFLIEPYVEVDGAPHAKLTIEQGHTPRES